MTTGFFVRSSPEHNASLPDSQPTKPEIDESSGDVFQEDNKTTEKSTAGELMPDALGSTEGDRPKDENLEDNSGKQTPPALSKSEDNDSEHVHATETTSDPPIMEASIPAGNSSVVETTPVLSDNTGDNSVTEESQVSSNSSHPDVVEMPSVSIGNSEDHTVKEITSELPTLKNTNPVDNFTGDNPAPFSPPFYSTEDSLTSITYEKPEDAEDDPDGIASMLHLRKESIKGEEMIQMQDMADSNDQCVVTLISRRSRYRAGTYMIVEYTAGQVLIPFRYTI